MMHILVVEDNAANLELMTYLLEAYGHTTASARNGEEGIALARQLRPQLVLCDLQMPHVDGFRLLEAIREDAALRHIPVVAVTASAMVGDRDAALAAGFDGYISKPISPGTFVEEVVGFARKDADPSGAVQRPAASP
jgi:two-component system cell cycle response regulator